MMRFIVCRHDGGSATTKENCGVARAPVETEAVQHAWVAHMRSERGSEKPEVVGSTPTPGTNPLMCCETPREPRPPQQCVGEAGLYPSSSAEEHRISNPLVGSSNLSLGANHTRLV